MKSPRTLAFIAAGVVLIAALAWYFTRRDNEPVNVAASWNKYLVEGDASSLYDVSFPIEKKHYDLDDSELERLQDRFFRPKVAGTTWVDVNKRSIDIPGEFQNQSLGTAQGLVELPSGRRILQIATAYPQGGAGHIRFANALFDAWEIAKMKKLDRALTKVETIDAWIEGINQDRGLLESVGVDGSFPSPERNSDFNPWDSAIVKLERLRAQLQNPTSDDSNHKDTSR